MPLLTVCQDSHSVALLRWSLDLSGGSRQQPADFEKACIASHDHHCRIAQLQLRSVATKELAARDLRTTGRDAVLQYAASVSGLLPELQGVHC